MTDTPGEPNSMEVDAKEDPPPGDRANAPSTAPPPADVAAAAAKLAQYRNVKHSTTHPKFLHSNSTSHRWVFGAIAELIDNAMDPDVNASQFCIDMQEFDKTSCLVFMDNGYGMSPEKLHRMLGFGHSDKKEVNGHRPIGFYGNGFKSGSMRLGKDALVLTKCRESQSVGFLSQTFLEDTKATDVLVPIVTWNHQGERLNPDTKEVDESLGAICKYSIFNTEAGLLAQLGAIPETGCIIIVSNLRKNGDLFELDFESDRHDIRIAQDDYGAQNFQQQRNAQPRETDVPLDYSLRVYVAYLYKVPRMQIFLRDKKVKSKRITSVLKDKIHEQYRPSAQVLPQASGGGRTVGLRADIEVGFNTEASELYGMMLYHKNRLIRPFMRVGIQLEANEKGVGVLGVVEADFLQPTHNKQDFDDTRAYRALVTKLAEILKIYWWDQREKRKPPPTLATERGDRLPAPRPGPGPAAPGAASTSGATALPAPGADGAAAGPAPAPEALPNIPDDLWVQCDYPNCLKWRRLPAGTDPHKLADNWFCYMHPDPVMAQRSHEAPEETYAAPLEAQQAKASKREYEQERKQQDAERKRQRQEEAERKAAQERQVLLDKERAELYKQQQMAIEAERLRRQQVEEQHMRLVEEQRRSEEGRVQAEAAARERQAELRRQQEDLQRQQEELQRQQQEHQQRLAQQQAQQQMGHGAQGGFSQPGVNPGAPGGFPPPPSQQQPGVQQGVQQQQQQMGGMQGQLSAAPHGPGFQQQQQQQQPGGAAHGRNSEQLLMNLGLGLVTAGVGSGGGGGGAGGGGGGVPTAGVVGAGSMVSGGDGGGGTDASLSEALGQRLRQAIMVLLSLAHRPSVEIERVPELDLASLARVNINELALQVQEARQRGT